MGVFFQDLTARRLCKEEYSRQRLKRDKSKPFISHSDGLGIEVSESFEFGGYCHPHNPLSKSC
jgi:hypothetical protein